jgi:hypothetical protein
MEPGIDIGTTWPLESSSTVTFDHTLPYRLLAMVIAALALVAFGWVKGAAHVQTAWDLESARQRAEIAAIQQRQADATVQVVTKYVDRIQVVRQIGDTIIKEVPIYVSPDSDARCTLPVGFVRLHNAAAENRIPGPAGNSDATAAGVAISAVAETVADNYTRCHANAGQLMALQEWIIQMKQAAELAHLNCRTNSSR